MTASPLAGRLTIRRVRRNACRAAVAATLVYLTLGATPGRAESAIAYGQTPDGTWAAGYGWGLATQSQAQATAIQNCQSRGIACSVIATFSKTCGAFATPNLLNGWATGYAATDAAARRDALQRCGSMGLPCSVVESYCDTLSEQEQAYHEYQEYARQWGECFGSGMNEIDAARNLASCDQALTFPRALPADRDKVARQRAAWQTVIQNYRDQARRAEQEARDHAQREEQQRIQSAAEQREQERYFAQHKACSEFEVASCTAALQNPLSVDDRNELRSWLEEAQRFNEDVAACRNGSVTACDLAASSNVASADYRQYIKQWRAAASPLNKFLALILPYWQWVRATWNSVVTMVAEIPFSTIIASGVAALFAISLLGILFIQRRRSTHRPSDSRKAGKPSHQMDATALSEAEPAPILMNIESENRPAGQNGAATVDTEAIKQSFRKRRVEFEL